MRSSPSGAWRTEGRSAPGTGLGLPHQALAEANRTRFDISKRARQGHDGGEHVPDDTGAGGVRGRIS